MTAHVSYVPVFQGELGLKIRFHVPYVYAMGKGHVVEIEEGDEALYPLASEWRIVPRALDDKRHGGPGNLFPVKRFVPEPHVKQDVSAEIVVCPRKRNYGSGKNWPHWHQVTSSLQLSLGYEVFAAGAPDSSFDVPCEAAWDRPRFLDASIEAIRQAKLVIATDAGLAHLAVLCGAPLLIITFRGLVAPGPVIDSGGHISEKKYWPVRLHDYYESANHKKIPIRTVDGWEHPAQVLAAANKMLNGA